MSQPKSSAPLLYAVVEFDDVDDTKKSTEIVPISWLNNEEDYCYWPPWKAAKISSSAKKLVEPQSSWKLFPVRSLGKAGMISYVIADTVSSYVDIQSEQQALILDLTFYFDITPY